MVESFSHATFFFSRYYEVTKTKSNSITELKLVLTINFRFIYTWLYHCTRRDL